MSIIQYAVKMLLPCYGNGPAETIEQVNVLVATLVRKPPPNVITLFVPAGCDIPEVASFDVQTHSCSRLVVVGFSGGGTPEEWYDAMVVAGLIEGW